MFTWDITDAAVKEELFIMQVYRNCLATVQNYTIHIWEIGFVLCKSGRGIEFCSVFGNLGKVIIKWLRRVEQWGVVGV